MFSARKRAIVAILLWISICQNSARAGAGNDNAVKTGAFSISATPAEMVGPDSSAAFAAIVPVDEAIDWQIVVPESYDPGNPPGLLIYISPTNSGRLPREWNGLPESHNIIWVAADASGNQIAVARRISYTLFADRETALS